MRQPEISVIIVSFNTGPILARAIEAVLAQKGLHELILVDNGNPDDARVRLDMIMEGEPKIKIIRGQGNIGFSKACNLGARQASGNYLLILNPDCIIPENALLDTVKSMRENPETWLAGVCMVTPDGKPQWGSKRNLFNFKIAFSEVLQLWRINQKKFPRLNLEEGEEQSAEYVPAISGAYMMMEREKYEEIGGMDEGYFFHVEDLDFCYEIKNRGGKILFIPFIKTVHYRSTSKVSGFIVEWHKARGFSRYFLKRFREGRNGNKWLKTLLIMGIFLRLLARVPLIAARESYDFFKSNGKYKRHAVQLDFLNTPIDTSEQDDSNPVENEPVLLIGCTGQVGLSILRRLLAKNTRVKALYHTETIDFRNPNLSWVQGSLENAPLPVNGFKPKTVISTAAIWMLPKHLEQLAKAGVKRLICFSSTSIESKAESKNSYEQHLVYQFNKAEKDIAEKCKALGIEWTIFRPTMIYGIGLDRNVCSIERFIRKFHFFPMISPGAGLRKPVHTDDLAGAVINVLANKKTFGQTYNLAGGEELPYIEMVKRIAKSMNKNPRIILTSYLPFILDIFSKLTGSREVNGEVARRMNSDLVFPHDKAIKDFGYSPRGFLKPENSERKPSLNPKKKVA